MDNAEKYIKYALSQGAANAIKFDISDICFDPRTYLKCLRLRRFRQKPHLPLPARELPPCRI